MIDIIILVFALQECRYEYNFLDHVSNVITLDLRSMIEKIILVFALQECRYEYNFLDYVSNVITLDLRSMIKKNILVCALQECRYEYNFLDHISNIITLDLRSMIEKIIPLLFTCSRRLIRKTHPKTWFISQQTSNVIPFFHSGIAFHSLTLHLIILSHTNVHTKYIIK